MMFMFTMGVVVGLGLGWCFIPQPKWVENLYSRWFDEGR